jgi:hypothetical protein
VISKFIREEIYYDMIKVREMGRKGETFLALCAGNGSKDSVMIYFKNYPP